ncbi:MAG: hypothetical protein RIR29_796, partial [Actinomycetota bacterium]
MLKFQLPSISGSECGSSLVEFTILMPLLISVFSTGFSQVLETQMREQALTAFTFSLAREVELGASRDELAEFASLLQADARFEHPPTLTFDCPDVLQFCSVTTSYREANHTSLIDGRLVHDSLRLDFEAIDLGAI